MNAHHDSFSVVLHFTTSKSEIGALVWRSLPILIETCEAKVDVMVDIYIQ